MYEAEARDAWGNPLGACPTRPVASVSGARAPTTANIDQSMGKNEKLPWVAFSWFLSGAALIGVLLLAWFVPIMIDAKVKSGSAKCEAISELARTDAAVAKDTVDQWAAKQKAGAK